MLCEAHQSGQLFVIIIFSLKRKIVYERRKGLILVALMYEKAKVGPRYFSSVIDNPQQLLRDVCLI